MWDGRRGGQGVAEVGVFAGGFGEARVGGDGGVFGGGQDGGDPVVSERGEVVHVGGGGWSILRRLDSVAVLEVFWFSGILSGILWCYMGVE